MLKSYLESCLCLVFFLRVICWTELFVEELFGKLFVFGEFFELFVGQSYLLKSYLESCLCLV